MSGTDHPGTACSPACGLLRKKSADSVRGQMEELVEGRNTIAATMVPSTCRSWTRRNARC
jgi:hypothetical protein